MAEDSAKAIKQRGIDCVPLWAIHGILTAVVITSVIFNCFIIQFTRKEFKANFSTYVVCLFCMSANNLVATCVSLPLHYIEFYTTNVITHLPLQLANAICFTRFVSLFTHLGVGICALNIICWDRYEALTRLGKERRLTASIARRTILATGLFVVIYVVVSMHESFRKMAGGFLYCFERQSYNKSRNTVDIKTRMEKTSVPIIVLVSAIMVSSKSIAIFTFSSITNKVRRHIVEVQGTLGHLNTTKELNLVKVSVIIFIAYTVTWLPYGISTTLVSVLAPKESISCFFYISYFIAYSLFSVLPLLCVITDKKMKSNLLRIVRLNTRVSPGNNQQGHGQETGKTNKSTVL